MKNKRSLIVLAGDLKKGPYLSSLIKEEYDFIIAVDGGFSHCLDLGIVPDFLIGDLDSISKESLFLAGGMGVTIEKFPSKKALTDSELAFKLAIEEQVSFTYLIGALAGKRADHFLANIFLFNQFYDKIHFQIVDGYQKISLLESQKKFLIEGEQGDYISIIPFGTDLIGLEGEGFLYSLNNLSIERGHSLGLSNELIERKASIYLKEGKGLVIQSKIEIT